MAIFFVFFLIGILAFIVPKYVKFQGSEYQQVSGNSFIKTLFDKGNYGEFLTFTKLEKLSGHNKLLTNLYLPKKDGSTTEVDVLMISETGLYVLESKNYSGWIFGDEKNRFWTQTLPNKQKEKFFNPIWQNQVHINAIKSVLALEDNRLIQSYIIFSERCTLKKMNVTSSNVKVMKRNALIPVIKSEILNNSKVLTNFQIESYYAKLKQYLHADEALKKEHIKRIQMKN